VSEVLEPIVHTPALRCAPAMAFDAYAEFREWPLLLDRFAALAEARHSGTSPS